LSRQGVAPAILASLRRTAANPLRATLRAKKAVACLLYMSSLAMADMERVLTQFGGSPGGAAGAIRSIASRTSDLIAVAARVAEVIHPSLDLQHRASRMTIRLTYGVPSETVDLARILGAELLRGDYIELAGAGLCDGRSIIDAEVASVAALLGGSTKKAEAVLKAGRKLASQGPIEAAAPSPLLEIYKP
jgi:hypothetical protein